MAGECTASAASKTSLISYSPAPSMARVGVSPPQLRYRVQGIPCSFPLLVRTVSLFALHQIFTGSLHPPCRSTNGHNTYRSSPTSHIPCFRSLTSYDAKWHGCIVTDLVALNPTEHAGNHPMYCKCIGNWWGMCGVGSLPPLATSSPGAFHSRGDALLELPSTVAFQKGRVCMGICWFGSQSSLAVLFLVATFWRLSTQFALDR